MTYGYLRVSTKGQNEDRQLLAMQGLSIPIKLFTDKESGKDFERTEYKKLLKRLKRDDVLYLTSIDRLGRNYREVLDQWKIITKDIGADIVVIDMPLLDTRKGKDLMGTFIADLVLQVLAFVAESERENIRKRQREGIDAAKKRGVKFGRPKFEPDEAFWDVYEQYINGEKSVYSCARMLGIDSKTFLRLIRDNAYEQKPRKAKRRKHG